MNKVDELVVGVFGVNEEEEKKMQNEDVKTCCICGKKFRGHGNNPEPVMPLEYEDEGDVVYNECCDWCDWHIVLATRLHISEMIQYAEKHSEPNFSMENYWKNAKVIEE